MNTWLGIVWRRLLVLLIGGIVAVPTIAVLAWIGTALGTGNALAASVVTAIGALLLVLLTIPAFLEVIRALERTLAAQLLGVRIPIPPRRPRTADRLRGAVFYLGHVVSGGLLLVTVFFIVPTLISVIIDPSGTKVLLDTVAGPASGLLFEGRSPAAGQAAALGLIVVVTLFSIGFLIVAGYLLPHYALLLLGPSADDRRALAARAGLEEFRRHTLAREVHDSIGHALTVTTMQAAVAKRALHTDPDLAEAAVDEIARTGREAVAELDHVLALLRAEAGGQGSAGDLGGEADSVERAAGDDSEGAAADGTDRDRAARQPPRRGLDDIDRLVADARDAGLDVDLGMDGDRSAVDATTAHEIHHIVRETVTNSMRHAAEPVLDLRIAITEVGVALVARNSVNVDEDRGGRRRDGGETGGHGGSGHGRQVPEDRGHGGRGLQGIRERAEVLGGEAVWGVADGVWELRVRVPAATGAGVAGTQVQGTETGR